MPDHCTYCGLPCTTERRDVGPSNTFGGGQHDWRDLSACCEADVTDHDPRGDCPDCTTFREENDPACPLCHGTGVVLRLEDGEPVEVKR
jgi:hypothetical protein